MPDLARHFGRRMKPKKPRALSYEERQRACGCKVRYETLAEARAYIRSVNSRVPLSAYRCPVCKGLHITSSE